MHQREVEDKEEGQGMDKNLVSIHASVVCGFSQKLTWVIRSSLALSEKWGHILTKLHLASRKMQRQPGPPLHFSSLPNHQQGISQWPDLLSALCESALVLALPRVSPPRHGHSSWMAELG